MNETGEQKARRAMRLIRGQARGTANKVAAEEAEAATITAFERAEEADLLERLLKAEREYLQRDANIRATDGEYQRMLQVEEWGWAREAARYCAHELALIEKGQREAEPDGQ